MWRNSVNSLGCCRDLGRSQVRLRIKSRIFVRILYINTSHTKAQILVTLDVGLTQLLNSLSKRIVNICPTYSIVIDPIFEQYSSPPFEAVEKLVELFMDSILMARLVPTADSSVSNHWWAWSFKTKILLLVFSVNNSPLSRFRKNCKAEVLAPWIWILLTFKSEFFMRWYLSPVGHAST